MNILGLRAGDGVLLAKVLDMAEALEVLLLGCKNKSTVYSVMNKIIIIRCYSNEDKIISTHLHEMKIPL